MVCLQFTRPKDRIVLIVLRHAAVTFLVSKVNQGSLEDQTCCQTTTTKDEFHEIKKKRKKQRKEKKQSSYVKLELLVCWPLATGRCDLVL